MTWQFQPNIIDYTRASFLLDWTINQKSETDTPTIEQYKIKPD